MHSRSSTELKRDISFDNRSQDSSIPEGSQMDVPEVNVMECVVDLAKDIRQNVLDSNAAKLRLKEIAEQMINEIIEKSDEKLQGFLSIIQREQSNLSEHRSETALSSSPPASNVLSGMASRSSTRLDDEAIQSLAANFLDDLADSVVMHLEDILDEQLMHVVGLIEEKEETSSESENDN
ncbi:hypothetical protein FBUS_03533 [Fasciolopsis buskii]|uniref:Uncharacterized protein n=1 Tax=Fasciolopsis buskii TaxID=27845 RepID=A0A8E0VFC6_9TREM|nr:hypothetical protein FBUS_03533 [Fasciolopsis buski]